MTTNNGFSSSAACLSEAVESFESELARNPDADFTQFLPDPSQDHFAEVLAELIRVEMDFGWMRGRQPRLDAYLQRFPLLRRHSELLEGVAFEEYRQRRRAGETAQPDDYARQYAIDVSSWPRIDADNLGRASNTPIPIAPPTQRVEAPLACNNPDDLLTDQVGQWLEDAAPMPEIGSEFLGFRLIRELGRGAFGRVYLAQQGDLGRRLVALKVATDNSSESITLSQLQHSNIVPIYSCHRDGQFQALCMPFFGATTLAHVLQGLRSTQSLPVSGRDLHSALTVTPSLASAANLPPSRLDPADGAAVLLPAEMAPITSEGWRRLDRLSYVEAILALGSQLAEGLSHAHARGILHRDMKPANVLLTDDGRPMLLDFNLAEDIKQRGSLERAAIGGTLQYMAPEHLQAFVTRKGTLDSRCDIYSLGAILFELLTGRHPYPSHPGPLRERLVKLLEDRKSVPRLRLHNSAVSPGAEAIVRKCLAPAPADRYLTAEQLHEDLERHLNHQPLKYAGNPSLRESARKWMRRHPRLASSGTVAVLAASLLIATGVGVAISHHRNQGFQARALFADHQAAFSDAQVFFDDRNQSRADFDATLEKLKSILNRYEVPVSGQNDKWLEQSALTRLSPAERDRCRSDIGETFYLMGQTAYLKLRGQTAPDGELLAAAQAWNAAAERSAGTRMPRAILEQRAALAEVAGDAAAAARGRADAATHTLETSSARDNLLVATSLAQQARKREALPYAIRATQTEPENFSAWFVRGNIHQALDQFEQAVPCFTACIALREQFAPAWLNRAGALGRRRFFDQALADCDQAVALQPDWPKVYIQRAVIRDALGDLRGAEADLTLALQTGQAPVRVYFLRADARERLKDAAGAKADRAEGLKRTPADELSWTARAEARLDDAPAAALDDVEEALKVNPLSATALQLKAHILGERLHRNADALAVLYRGVQLHPEHIELRAGRGVLLARLNRRTEALADAQIAFRLDTNAPNTYQVACIYALTSKTHAEDKAEAFRLLWRALKTGYGLDLVDSDEDLNSLRNDDNFKRIVADARTIQRSRQQ